MVPGERNSLGEKEQRSLPLFMYRGEKGQSRFTLKYKSSQEIQKKLPGASLLKALYLHCDLGGGEEGV